MSRQDRAIVPIQAAADKPYLDSADFVIIGNGIAGLTAALEARRLAPDKRIVMITDQIHPTINTPALKQFATGKLNREQLLAYPAGTERMERIHVVTARVQEIHAKSKYVTLNGDRGFGYGTLLIATGSAPTGLPANLPGRDFDGVLTLHRLQDYMDLRRRLPEVEQIVVIGGGVHAIETVMGMLFWGIRVHWLIRSSTFMPRVLDEISSEMVLSNVRRAGAMVYTDTEVVGIVGRIGTVAGVITNHQKMIPCDLVLACVGTHAVTDLAKHCSQPLKSERGIVVDDQLRTSVPDILAAGDTAALKNPQTGKYEPRAQWYAAVAQGRVAGAMLAGRTDLASRPFGVQWHATHLGELYMLTVGDPMLKGERVTTLTDNSQGGYRRMALVDDRLIGYLSLGNSQPDSLAVKRIIDEGYSVRSIIKDLLKGNIDARKYLSDLRSRAAQGILTAGSLPIAALADDPLTQVPLLPPASAEPAGAAPAARQKGDKMRDTDPLIAADGAAHTRKLEPSAPYGKEMSPSTETRPGVWSQEIRLQDLPTSVSSSSAQLPIVSGMEEEVSPFTGNLPAVPDLPTEDEEINPFTGNLPAIAQPTRIVESRPAPQPTGRWSTRTRTGGLWAYAETGNKGREEETTRAGGTPVEKMPVRRPSRSLWSYGKRP
jgi:NADPH-dependent 2,4-dienoyl-CoA reductase/sulfur reductase-like enzyme